VHLGVAGVGRGALVDRQYSALLDLGFGFCLEFSAWHTCVACIGICGLADLGDVVKAILRDTGEMTTHTEVV